MFKRMYQLAVVLCVLSATLQAADRFKNVQYMYNPEGKDKGEEIGGTLNFDAKAQMIGFASKKVNLELQGASITNALYERTSRPRYVSGLLLAWPLLFTKGKKHFLTIRVQKQFG